MMWFTLPVLTEKKKKQPKIRSSILLPRTGHCSVLVRGEGPTKFLVKKRSTSGNKIQRKSLVVRDFVPNISLSSRYFLLPNKRMGGAEKKRKGVCEPWHSGLLACAVCILRPWLTQKDGTSSWTFIYIIAPPMHSLGSHKDVISIPFFQDRSRLGATSTSSGPSFLGLENPRPFPEGSTVLPLPQIAQVQLFKSLHQEAESLKPSLIFSWVLIRLIIALPSLLQFSADQQSRWAHPSRKQQFPIFFPMR